LLRAVQGRRVPNKPQGGEVVISDQDGSQQRVVAGGPQSTMPQLIPPDGLAWSPNGNLLAFSGAVGKRHFRLFLISSDGSELRGIPGTSNGVTPVFSPDGQTIAFARIKRQQSGSSTTTFGEKSRPRQSYVSISTWTVDLASGSLHQLTPWRNGLENIPNSFSPDGSVLGLTRRKDLNDASEALALRMNGSGSTVLARGVGGPVYSPSGSEIALVGVHRRVLSHRASSGKTAALGVETSSALYLISADGTDLRRLVGTPHRIDAQPKWDPSGQRLVYTQSGNGSEAALFGFGDAIMEINANGTCPTKVLAAEPETALYSPTWQPGLGRGAGPIQCSSR
jgi:dipeptidyl aminopeptidase/acylaminoacyl peptidase